MIRHLLIVMGFILFTQPLSFADSLEFIRTIQLTTNDEGGGARPEVVYLQDKFYIFYLVPKPDTGSPHYDVQIYDANFENPITIEGLVVEDTSGRPTDVQLATDGNYIFNAYEKVKMDTHRLFVEKYDTALARVAGPKFIVSRIDPLSWGDEKLDDPSPFIADSELCVVTYFHHRYATENHFRIRHLDINTLNTLGPIIDISVNPFNPVLNNVSSQIHKDNFIYFAFAGENKYDASQPPHDSSDIIIIKFLSDYSSIDTSYIVVDGSRDTTMNVRPSGFIFDDGKFYISHHTIKQLIPYRSGGDIFLRVFDSLFNPIQEIAVLDTAIGHHATIALRGKSIYVAYQVANDTTNPIYSNVFVSEYKWSQQGVTEYQSTGNCGMVEVYPNPFISSAWISYRLPKAGKMQLVIYNILGQAVRTLVNRNQPAGSYSVIWDGRDDKGRMIPSGAYFSVLRLNSSLYVIKILKK